MKADDREITADGEQDHARAILAEAWVELQRARAQIEASLLMGLETAQGRADHLARSIEVFGRPVETDEMILQLRSAEVATVRAAGAALLDGPVAVASVGARLALAA